MTDQDNLTIDKLQKTMDLLRERMAKDAFLGSTGGYSPMIETGQRKPGYTKRHWFTPASIRIIESNQATERVTGCRRREENKSFWERLKAILKAPAPLSYWQYTPVEFYEYDKPAMFWMSGRRTIVCHPSLVEEIKRQIEAN